MQTNTDAALTTLIEQLRKALAEEVPGALRTLLTDNYQHRIYNIGLYYAAGSWSYCLPTLASEEGLKKVAGSYAVHSMLSFDEVMQQLRWSPCDSPHHSDEALENMMPNTQDALESLSMYCDDLYDYESEDFEEDDSAIEDIHNTIHACVISELKKAVTDPAMQEYIAQGGLITLQAGDRCHEDFLADVAAIMGEAAHKRVEDELSIATELFGKECRLQQSMTEEELLKMEATDLSIENFRSVIDSFSPDFIEMDGGVYLSSERYFPAYTDSEQEALNNRFSLWDLLRTSSHFEEIYQKFGGLSGKAPARDDLLPTIAMSFAKKLKTRLQMTFPERRFKVYVCVSRLALSRIEFCTDRDDGFDFNITTDEILPGVQEIL